MCIRKFNIGCESCLTKKIIIILLCLCCILLYACVGNDISQFDDKNRSLTVYCPHPIDFINPIISEFEAQTGIKVYIYTNATGGLLQMMEDKQEPFCDVLWGGSLSVVMPKQHLFEKYISVNEDMVSDEFKNREGNMSRFADIPSVIMVNKNLVGELKVDGYEDLLQPRFKGKIAMCSPSISSSAQEHLINMLYAMGGGDPEMGWSYIEKFCNNLDGNLLESSSDVYNGVAQGRYAVGLTFEEAASHYIFSGSPIEIVYMKEGVVFTPDVVCIAKDAQNPDEAQEFVDFVTGNSVQSVIVNSLGRRSVRMDVNKIEKLLDKDDINVINYNKEIVMKNLVEWTVKFDTIFEQSVDRKK